MKKHSRAAKQSPSGSSKEHPKRSPTITIGMDLGDKSSRYCVLEEDQVVEQGSVPTTKPGLAKAFGARKRCRIAVEAGGQSAWVSRLLQSWGHEVIVANPRPLQLITQSSRKDDKVDAKTLARLARVEPELLRPIRHRSEKAQLDLMQIRVRAGLVEARTALVNTVRGLAKSVGERVPKCDPEALDQGRLAGLREPLRAVLKPLVEQVPKRCQSGQSDPQLRITKEGDLYLRRLLVQGAHRILSPRSPDTDLRRWGWKLAARGGKHAKQRALVAVARKLGILLHRLWVTAEVYEPLRNAPAVPRAA